MTPTLSSTEGTIDGPTDEPGCQTCYKCGEEIEPGDHIYRELFSDVKRMGLRGPVLDPTGGIVVKHWCDECYRRHRTREKAAHYDVEDGDRLWEILAAADGRLVADLLPMLVGGRAWIRVVDGEVESRHSVTERTDKGLRFTTEPTEEFDIEDFGEFFDDPGERTRVLLKPVEETPFADGTPGGED